MSVCSVINKLGALSVAIIYVMQWMAAIVQGSYKSG